MSCQTTTCSGNMSTYQCIQSRCWTNIALDYISPPKAKSFSCQVHLRCIDQLLSRSTSISPHLVSFVHEQILAISLISGLSKYLERSRSKLHGQFQARMNMAAATLTALATDQRVRPSLAAMYRRAKSQLDQHRPWKTSYLRQIMRFNLLSLTSSA